MMCKKLVSQHYTDAVFGMWQPSQPETQNQSYLIIKKKINAILFYRRYKTLVFRVLNLTLPCRHYPSIVLSKRD